MPARETAQLLQAIADFTSAYGTDSRYAEVRSKAQSLAADVKSLADSKTQPDTPGQKAAGRGRSTSSGGKPPIEAARALMGAAPRRGHA